MKDSDHLTNLNKWFDIILNVKSHKSKKPSPVPQTGACNLRVLVPKDKLTAEQVSHIHPLLTAILKGNQTILKRLLDDVLDNEQLYISKEQVKSINVLKDLIYKQKLLLKELKEVSDGKKKRRK